MVLLINGRFTEEDVNHYKTLNSSDDIKDALFEKIQEDDRQIEGIELILKDLFFYAYRFGQKNSMEPAKLCTFLNIMDAIHFTSMSKRLSLMDSFQLCKTTIVEHSVHRPPYAVEVFNQKDVENMSQYVYNTYYRQYKCYLYACTTREVMDVQSVYASQTEKFNVKPFDLTPLGESKTLEKWNLEHPDETQEPTENGEEDTKAAEEEEKEEEKDAGEEAKEEEEQTNDKDDHQKDEEPAEPPMVNPFIKRQLDDIKSMIAQLTKEKLATFEDKLANVEQTLKGDE